MMGVMDSFSHYSPLDYQIPINASNHSLCPSLEVDLRPKAFFPAPGKVFFTSVAKWGLSH